MIFESGMVLVGSAADLDERVRMPSNSEDDSVHLDDAVKSLEGH